MKNGPYELVVAPNGFPGMRYRGRYAYEHIVVFWKVNGFVPKPGFEIHHENGNHRDNRIENLKLVTNKEHRKIHSDLRSLKAKINFICFGCKKSVEMKGSFYRTRLRSSKNIYCSRKCYEKNVFVKETKSLKCSYCGIIFNRHNPPKRINYFCSALHGGLFRSRENKRTFRVGEIGITNGR